ncbi:protein IQ-DOMAIN 31-like [Diospyros lotus]|uniref:protein IQ-DOMAIN 31-like n=1 Tax=Diospyros lotus TaxID=55363 RepID=UPI002250C1F1|nr:protein IQ-DOMAIN 31-like [Diospyros lotus]XP_052174576.1 protein IQ-DOMAIN 31-like [Diospyros lotus]
MGKSPGKWIKTLLFGKKSSKSNFSKGREKLKNRKEVWVAKAKEADSAGNPPVASDLALNIISTNEKKLEDNSEAAISPLEGGTLLHGDRDSDAQATSQLDALKDPERFKQEQAATKTQAAFRGYLARRAFRALKGIIRLQALIRGHLVRRQAVSTLRCMLGIVKLQALARGRNVRCSNVGLEVQKNGILIKPLKRKHADPYEGNIYMKVAKLSGNAFVCTLLASSPTAMPFRLQYDSSEPNSVLSWLQRWSASVFWKPIPQLKKVPGTKSQKKQGNSQTVDSETGRLKQSVRRNYPLNLDSVSTQATSEIEKPRRNLRKVSSHPVESVQEHPQSELEKVKRSLRKVQGPNTESSCQSEVDGEKPKSVPAKVLSSLGQNNEVDSISGSAEKTKKETNATLSKQTDIEAISKQPVVNEVSDLPCDDQTTRELQPLESTGEGETIPAANGELSSMVDISVEEHQKSTKKASSSAKQEHIENGLQNRPTLPSYMAATESAKAKSRAQGSPRFGQDSVEKQNLTRRHSLPASTNSKTSSPSPKAQRPIQGSGKGGNRSDRSLSASRDGNGKVTQAEWRR